MVRVGQPFLSTVALAAAIAISFAAGCGAKNNQGIGDDDSGVGFGPPTGDDDDGGGGFSSSGGSSSGSQGMFVDPNQEVDAAAPACAGGGTGWKCAVDSSCGSTPTTLTGRVFDPAGNNPLYNALVFIPNDVTTLPAITQGTKSCSNCDASVGDYVVITQTDADGKFTLPNVPTGNNVPITVQMGKWRRTVTVSTTKCTTTSIPDGTVRLPRNQSEGDMPEIALLTGGCDDMACFLTGIGIDPKEFTAPHAGGRVDVYQGLGLIGDGAALSNGTAGDCTTSACPLWQSTSSFESYDITLLSCECNEHQETKPASAMQALDGWLNEGGKVFASHYHYIWFEANPDTAVQGVATWNDGSTLATGSGSYDVNNASTFPKGQVYGQWLGNVGVLATTGTPDTLDLSFVATSVTTVNSATTQDWIYDPSADTNGNTNDVKYLSFDTPIGGIPSTAGDGGESNTPVYCGKAVFTDLHTGSDLLAQYNSVPAMCPTNKKLTAQQAAMEFLFFDLSACVAPDTQPPPPPPPPAAQ